MIDDIEFLNDATRPKAPEFKNVTRAQKVPGRHLAMIHQHYRSNMKQVSDFLDMVRKGEASASDLKHITQDLPIVENYRRFGNICGQHCQLIEMHHNIEEQAIFPQLRAKSKGMRKVVERLQAEHEIVHTLLTRLMSSLHALMASPTSENFATSTQLYEALDRVLLSHFGYEETELRDALGFYNIQV